MARHAIVNKDHRVVNVVEWEGAEWLPPRDHRVIQSDKADIGDYHDAQSNAFIKTSESLQDHPDWHNNDGTKQLHVGKEYKVRNKFWEAKAFWNGTSWEGHRDHKGYILEVPIQQYAEQ